MAKSKIENELIEGLQEILAHKRGGRKLKGSTRELTHPAPDWTAKQIRALRQRVGMSQTEFAALLNVKVPTIRSWEQGQNIPSGAAARLLEVFQKFENAVEKLSA